MAKKSTTSAEEKWEKQDFDLFAALEALDRKDYGWWDRLSPEQQRKFSPWMMTQWLCCVKSGGPLGSYYLLSTDLNANKYMFNDRVMTHPHLQWLMLCAVSPGRGKQYRQWVPQLNERIGSLKTAADLKDVRTYFEKVYTGASQSDLDEISDIFVEEQNHRHRLAAMFPNMKLDDITALSQVVTPQQIDQYEKESGN